MIVLNYKCIMSRDSCGFGAGLSIVIKESVSRKKNKDQACVHRIFSEPADCYNLCCLSKTKRVISMK